MSGSQSSPMLGREQELAVLHDLIDHVRDRGGALVVRGDAGIGKTALLFSARERALARGVRVLTAAGVQSETALAFAGLHQLLHPVLSGASHLPEPLREAIHSAFGMTDASAPEFFHIALAALELLSDATDSGPVLVLVEDAQWLDRPTSDVLAFVAWRLESEAIAALFAVRDGAHSPLTSTGLPELQVGGLPRPQAAALLDTRAPGLAATVRERLLDDAAGNPLALLELPAALGSDLLRGSAQLPDPLPLTERLERAFAWRVSGLPDQARAILLVAALDDTSDLAEILAAAAAGAGTEMTVAALEPAVAAGLVTLDYSELRFRHPLVRSAIYQAASVSERLSVHTALAKVLSSEPDRQVWHRAAAAPEADETIASELETAAMHARRRGAVTVAVSALERSARLSRHPESQSRRLLLAAELGFELGRRDIVDRLLSEVAPVRLDERGQARLEWLWEVFEEDVAHDPARVRSLARTARRIRQQGDAGLAMNFLRAAALRCWWNDPGEDTRVLVLTSAEETAVAADDPSLLTVFGLAAPVERGALVCSRIAQLDPVAVLEPGSMRLLGTVAAALGAFDLAAPRLTSSIAGLRSQGRLGLLPQALVTYAFAAIYTGDWDSAVPTAEEGHSLARETAQPRWLAAGLIARTMLAGLRGDCEAADALAAEAERAALPLGNSYLLALLQHARGLAALGGGRPDEAYRQLRRLFEPTDAAFHPHVRGWAIGDLAEAAAQIGDLEDTRTLLSQLEAVEAVSHSPMLRIGLRYARAQAARQEGDAETAYLAGLGPDVPQWPFFRARLLLGQGSWLRRQHRITESRSSLRAAREAFDTLGATPWSERARQELRASGETSRPRTPRAQEVLTPQELQIAQLAAAGLSNREIGQQLYLSHRTIGSHLYRLFPKLGITSRAQLSTALASNTAVN